MTKTEVRLFHYIHHFKMFYVNSIRKKLFIYLLTYNVFVIYFLENVCSNMYKYMLTQITVNVESVTHCFLTGETFLDICQLFVCFVRHCNSL